VCDRLSPDSPPQGRRFWQENFIRQEEVEWEDFVDAFYSFLRIDAPKDKDFPEEGVSNDAEQFCTHALSESMCHLKCSDRFTPQVSPYLLVGMGGQLKGDCTEDEEEEEKDLDSLPNNDILNLRCLKELLVNDHNKSGEDKFYVNVERFGSILNWFGPLARKKEWSPFLDSIREILQMAWFHG